MRSSVNMFFEMIDTSDGMAKGRRGGGRETIYSARRKTRRKRSKACHRYRQMTLRTSLYGGTSRAANLSKELLKDRSPQVVAAWKDDTLGTVLTKAGPSLFPPFSTGGLFLANNYLTLFEFSKYLHVGGYLRQCRHVLENIDNK